MSILSHSHCIINMNPSDTCPKKAETKNQDEATAPQNDKDLWRTISEKEDQLDERIENLLKDLEAHEIDDDNDVLKYDFSQSRNNYEIFQRDILPIVGLRAPNIWTERYKPCVKERQRDENEVIKQELEDIRTQTDSRSNFTKRHLLHNKCRSQSFVGQSPYAITPTSSELVLDTDVCDYLMTHLYSPRCLSNHTNIYQQTREERLQGINAVSTIPSELVWPRDKYGLRIPSDTILNNFHKILIHEQKTGKCMTPSELQLRLGANRSNTGTRTEASVQTDPAMNSTSPTPFQMYVALRRDIARIKAEEDKHKQLNMMQNLLEHHRNINYLRDLPLATYMTYKYPQEDNVKPESYWASARPRTHQYVVRPSEERRNNRVNQTTLITTPSQTEALDKKTYEQLRQLRREIEELQQEHARLSENTSPKMSHGAMLKRSMVNKSFSYDSKLRKAHQENVQPRLPFSLPSLPESSDSIKKFGCASWEPAISPIQSKSTLASRLLTEVQSVMSGKIAILKKIQSQKQILHAVREAKLRPNTSKNPPSEVSVERNHSRRDGWDSGIIKFSYQQSAHGQEFGARVMSLEQYHDQCEAGRVPWRTSSEVPQRLEWSKPPVVRRVTSLKEDFSNSGSRPLHLQALATNRSRSRCRVAVSTRLFEANKQ